MALVAMGLGVFVIANDFTALNVALPSIEGDLDADVGSVQWVINAYALVFGMAIVSGGRIADMFGRRRVFFIGSDPVRRLLGDRRRRPGPRRPDRRPRRDGRRRRADVAGDPRHDVRRPAGVEGRPGRRADPRRRRDRQRGRAAARRRPHRGAELALDLRRQRPDRRLRDVRHLAQGPSARGAVEGAHRLRGHGDHLRGPGAAPPRPRPGRRLGLDRLARPDDAGARGRPDRLLRGHRAARRRPCPDPTRRHRHEALPRRLPRRPAALGGVLLDRPLHPAVLREDPRLLDGRGRARDVAAARLVRARLVHRRAALQQGRDAAGRRRRDRLHRARGRPARRPRRPRRRLRRRRARVCSRSGSAAGCSTRR